jgi:hypothetical protein
MNWLYTAFQFEHWVTVSAQGDIKIQDKYTAHNKGKSFCFLRGTDMLYQVRFTFRCKIITLLYIVVIGKLKRLASCDYINPAKMTIPQTNFKLGYFITDHYSIALYADHTEIVRTLRIKTHAILLNTREAPLMMSHNTCQLYLRKRF